MEALKNNIWINKYEIKMDEKKMTAAKTQMEIQELEKGLKQRKKKIIELEEKLKPLEMKLEKLAKKLKPLEKEKWELLEKPITQYGFLIAGHYTDFRNFLIKNKTISIAECTITPTPKNFTTIHSIRFKTYWGSKCYVEVETDNGNWLFEVEEDTADDLWEIYCNEGAKFKNMSTFLQYQAAAILNGHTTIKSHKLYDVINDIANQPPQTQSDYERKIRLEFS